MWLVIPSLDLNDETNPVDYDMHLFLKKENAIACQKECNINNVMDNLEDAFEDVKFSTLIDEVLFSKLTLIQSESEDCYFYEDYRDDIFQALIKNYNLEKFEAFANNNDLQTWDLKEIPIEDM